MRTLLALLVVALAAGAAGAATAPSKEVALSELRAAIAEEERAIALLGLKPPKLQGASIQLDRAADRLPAVADYASGVRLAPSVEQSLRQTNYLDRLLAGQLREGKPVDPDAYRRSIRELVEKKKAALEKLRTGAVPAGTPQCSDGKDNDGDGIVDWTLEPGCTSARDLREQSPFSCDVRSGVAAGRLTLTGSCSGTFSELEATFLDGLQLNGRFDVKHATGCSPPTVTRVRCTTKNGAQNPRRLVDMRFATTARAPGQRVQLRVFDARKRQIARFVVLVR